jgi:hypothetical protein
LSLYLRSLPTKMLSPYQDLSTRAACLVYDRRKIKQTHLGQFMYYVGLVRPKVKVKLLIKHYAMKTYGGVDV